MLPLDVLKNINKASPDLEVSLGFFRRALTTDSLEEKILMLSTCLERIASSEATDKVSKFTCISCNHIPEKLICERCGIEH